MPKYLNCRGSFFLIQQRPAFPNLAFELFNESSIETLNQQEGKYANELEAALAQYTELQQEAAVMISSVVHFTIIRDLGIKSPHIFSLRGLL